MPLTMQIVVFLDLLGFRNRMMAVADDHHEASQLLSEYDDVMSTGLEALGEETDWFKLRGFTDNLVFGIPFDALGDPESAM